MRTRVLAVLLLEVLGTFLGWLLPFLGRLIDRLITKLRWRWGDGGCAIALLGAASLAMATAGSLIGPNWKQLLVAGVAVALSVIVIYGTYLHRTGSRPRSVPPEEGDVQPVTSGPELLARYQEGERDFRGARLWSRGSNDQEHSVRDLSGADLRGAQLGGASLQRAILRDANLRRANLQGADLRHADLRAANLRRADLSGADLRDADLRGAKVSTRQLTRAKSLYGATMPDGTVHR